MMINSLAQLLDSYDTRQDILAQRSVVTAVYTRNQKPSDYVRGVKLRPLKCVFVAWQDSDSEYTMQASFESRSRYKLFRPSYPRIKERFSYNLLCTKSLKSMLGLGKVSNFEWVKHTPEDYEVNDTISDLADIYIDDFGLKFTQSILDFILSKPSEFMSNLEKLPSGAEVDYARVENSGMF